MSNLSATPPALNLIESLKRPLLIALVAAVLAAGISLLMPNYYRSEARLLPTEAKGGGSAIAGLASSFGLNLGAADGVDANFVDVLGSRWLAEQLIQTPFDYHIKSWKFAEEKTVHGTLFGYLKVANMDQAVGALPTLMGFSRDLRTKVIVLSVETKSPELSQQIVKRALQLLEVFAQDIGKTRGGAKAAFASARLKEARQGMEEAETAFLRFMEANRSYQTSGDPAIRLKGLRLEGELQLKRQLVTSLSMAQENALMEAKNDQPILNVLDSGNLPIDKSRPKRSSIVLLVGALALASAWAWYNREWVKHRILLDEA